jgi:hypothetical protein
VQLVKPSATTCQLSNILTGQCTSPPANAHKNMRETAVQRPRQCRKQTVTRRLQETHKQICSWSNLQLLLCQLSNNPAEQCTSACRGTHAEKRSSLNLSHQVHNVSR